MVGITLVRVSNIISNFQPVHFHVSVMAHTTATNPQAHAMQPALSCCPNPEMTSGRAVTRVLGHAALSALIAMMGACASPPLPPVNSDLPESLRAPSDEVLEDVLTTTGDVLYQCDRSADGVAWVYHGVESTLVNSTGESVGTALPGGYFTGYDDSYVVTRPDAEATVSPDSVSWARLAARFNAGTRTSEGRFARTGLIQRVNTKGGLPPDQLCATEGSTLYVPYSARYLMYRSPSQSAPATPSSSLSSPDEVTMPPGNETTPVGTLPLPDH